MGKFKRQIRLQLCDSCHQLPAELQLWVFGEIRQGGKDVGPRLQNLPGY